jgi:hypothetical protein
VTTEAVTAAWRSSIDSSSGSVQLRAAPLPAAAAGASASVRTVIGFAARIWSTIAFC